MTRLLLIRECIRKISPHFSFDADLFYKLEHQGHLLQCIEKDKNRFFSLISIFKNCCINFWCLSFLLWAVWSYVCSFEIKIRLFAGLFVIDLKKPMPRMVFDTILMNTNLIFSLKLFHNVLRNMCHHFKLDVIFTKTNARKF